MIYGLQDWLSEPTPGRGYCCQCPRLKYRVSKERVKLEEVPRPLTDPIRPNPDG